MAKKEDQFNVTFTLGVKVTKVGAKKDESDWYDLGPFTSVYHGMDYLQVTGTLAAIGGLAETLTDFGFAGAEAIGFNSKEVAKVKELAKG